jgi:rubrerythrin
MGWVTEFGSVDDILEFAITRELDSYEFYLSMSARMERPWMQDVFHQFAEEELGHKAKLEDVRRGEEKLPADGAILDMKMADYLVPGEASSDMDYQDALIIAMKKEKAAFRLYTNLADRVGDEPIRATLLGIAQEEAKHKLRFEVEYDDVILTDN